MTPVTRHARPAADSITGPGPTPVLAALSRRGSRGTYPAAAARRVSPPVNRAYYAPMIDSSSKTPRPDPLSEVLEDIRVAGVSYVRCELRHPWGLFFPKQAEARFHFLSAGPCWLHTDDRGWIELRAGEVLLLPRGAEHILASEPGCVCKPMDEQRKISLGGIVFRLQLAAGDGAATQLFCGSLSFVAQALRPLLDQMPDIIRRCEQAGDNATMLAVLEAMGRETAEARLGGATVLARLADVAATHMIRDWVNACADARGWLKAARDPQIGRVLAAIHRAPGDDWSVEALASLAGLSRSSFADKFRAVMGEGPAHYVARWRMQTAAEWLARAVPIAEIAERLGYESETSFSRAFKRIMGHPPRRWRRLSTAA